MENTERPKAAAATCSMDHRTCYCNGLWALRIFHCDQKQLCYQKWDPFHSKTNVFKKLVYLPRQMLVFSSSGFFVVFVIGSIDLSNNQSTHQCINRSIDLSIDRSIDLSIVHYVDISIYQSIDTSIDQSIDLSISRSIHQSIDLSLDRSIDLSIDQSIDLSIYQYIEQTLRRIGYTLKSVVLCRRMQAES